MAASVFAPTAVERVPMNRDRRPTSLVLAVLVAAVLGATALPSVTTPATASDPASHTVTVPDEAGKTVTRTWTGQTQPGANPSSGCTLPTDDVFGDSHEVKLSVPKLSGVTYSVTFEATWEDENQDLILTVLEGNRVEGSSDGGEPREAITTEELPAGDYTAAVCPFVADSPVEYNGKLTIKTFKLSAEQLPEPADDRGLKFSAEVPADIQRDEGEPLIEIAPDGRVYTCGPTGFSQAEDYAQVSTDGGDQFHLLGEPPRGQQSLGGGGDCALAISDQKNDEGNHQLSYVGLSGLLEFATATSPDNGHTFVSNALSGTGSAVDRQWTTASSVDRVFLNFNRTNPQRQIEVCTSNDAGVTYSQIAGDNCDVVSPSPLFPGPMRTIPGDLNTVNPGEPIVYYPWTQGTTVKLAVSMDDGETWNNCQLSTSEGEPGIQFATADHDTDGNIYVVYGDDADFNIYLTTLRIGRLDNCQGGTTDQEAFRANPGASDPVLVNRDPVKTAVFPWVAASAEPGRIAVSLYGTETPGRADSTDPKSWNVYVNQSLNALSDNPDFSQVKATTHPIHYDQVCLQGLGCTTGGDRSLVDFFAMDYNPDTGEYVVVFNAAHKRPDDAAGTVSSPFVIRQIAGPSGGGGRVDDAGRTVLRRTSQDPKGDALADYSSLFTPPETSNLPAADIRNVEVGPAIDPETGDPLPGGGFTVTMKIADLSDAALQEALAASGIEGLPAPSMLYIFRFVDGYRYAAIQANYDPVRGFTFGHSDYGATPSECGSPEIPVEGAPNDQCLQYQGETPIPGAVNQEEGTITLTAPLDLLQALQGSEGPGKRPDQVQAEPGDRIYGAAAFAQSNPFSLEDEFQSFLYPLDNSPAFDFLIPKTQVDGNGGNGNGNGNGPGGGVGNLGDDRDGGVGDTGADRDLPATGGQSLLTLLGLLTLGVGGFTALRHRRR